MTTVKMLKSFFEADGGRPITMDEMKALSAAERRELADAIALQRGLTYDAKTSTYV